jgi:hypothetical protein
METHIMEGFSGGGRAAPRGSGNPFRKEFTDILVLSKNELVHVSARKPRRSATAATLAGSDDRRSSVSHSNSFHTSHACGASATRATMRRLSVSHVASASAHRGEALRERRRLRTISDHMPDATAARVRSYVDGSDQGLSAELGGLLSPEDVAGHDARAQRCAAVPDFAECVRVMWRGMLLRQPRRGSATAANPALRTRSFTRCDAPLGDSALLSSLSSSQIASTATTVTLVKTMHVGSSWANRSATSGFAMNGTPRAPQDACVLRAAPVPSE